ncbi:hypothetical protein [Pseudomonas alloputida]|uniref:hypothetical protein n=1 Tax=Pseudomonas TaxID=286 RepID=UPI003EE8EBDD
MMRLGIVDMKFITPFSSDELARLRAYFDGDSNPRDSALFELLVGYGLRVNEVRNVRRAGAGYRVGFAPLKQIKQTPQLPIPYNMHSKAITHWINSAKVPYKGLLFVDDLDKTKPMSITKINRIVAAWLVIAGCPTQEGQGATFFRRKIYRSTGTPLRKR